MQHRDFLLYQKYIIDIEDFIILRKIKSDSPCPVYSVINQKTGQIYAAKVLKADKNDEEYNKIIKKIIGILVDCQHPTLIKFFGYSLKDFDGQNNATIFMELSQNSLSDLLKNNLINDTNRQIILVGIARAMMYLHQHKIIHHNLRPENILLDEKLHPHITDFYISYFTRNNAFNEKADVYSFGILLYHIITNSHPYLSIQNTGEESLQIIQKIVTDDLRPTFTVPIKESIRKLIEKCWSKISSQRPSFEDLFKKLAYNFDDSTYDIYNEKKYYLENVDIEKVRSYADNIDKNPVSFSEEISIKFSKLKESVEALENIMKPLIDVNEQLSSKVSELNDKINELKFMTNEQIKTEKDQLKSSLFQEEKTIIIDQEKETIEEKLEHITFTGFNALPLNSKQLIISEIIKKFPGLKDDHFFVDLNNLLLYILQFNHTKTCNHFKLVSKDSKDLLISNTNIELYFNNELMEMLLSCNVTEFSDLLKKFDDILIDFVFPSKAFDYFYKDMQKDRKNLIKYSVFLTGMNKITMYNDAKSYIFFLKIDSTVKEIEGGSVYYAGPLANMSNLIHIEIPDSVTFIGDSAFKRCESLKQIRFPSHITYIGNEVLSGCKSLIKVELPKESFIGSGAFSGCSEITTVDLPKNIASISENVFKDCSSLTEIEIRPYITSILNGAFEGCTSLKKIEIPSSVTSIGSKAFSKCKSLEHIIIPSSVKSLGENVFEECSKLVKVELPSSLISIETCLFSNCISIESIQIPSSIKYIGKNSFSGCKSLKKILLPNSLETINDYAFCACPEMTDIIIPSNVTNIGRSAFEYCTSLTNISFSSCPLTIISERFFINCKSITQIDIPSTIQKIDAAAFYECFSLVNIKIPSSVTSIGNSAFYGCISLISIHLPPNLTQIGANCFQGCSALANINIPPNVTKIEPSTFSSCLSLSQIQIPPSVNFIGEKAFCGCNSLSSIEIPQAVTVIDKELFNGCSSLTRIILPNTIKVIGFDAFSGCTSITKFRIPQSVETIDCGAFSGCTSLIDIYIPNSVKKINLGAFRSCTSLV